MHVTDPFYKEIEAEEDDQGDSQGANSDDEFIHEVLYYVNAQINARA